MAMSMMRKKPPALGSGLFDFNQPQQSPFALGSGLFDQPMPNPQEIAQAPEPAAGGGLFDDKLNALLSSPAFILGMNLLGASNQRNPWGTALNGTLQATSAMAKNKREQQKMEQDAEQHRAQMELSNRNATTQERLAAHAENKFGLDQKEFDAKLPYIQAQIEMMKAKAADIPADNARQQAKDAQERAIWSGLFGNLGLGSPGAGAPVPAPMPFSTPQTPGAPAVPPAWQQMRNDFQSQQPTRESERIGILQQELQNELAGAGRPEHIEGLKREIAATLTGQAPAAPAAPGGPGSSLTPQVPLGPSKGLALGMAAAQLKNPQLAALATQMTPKIEGGYMHNPIDGSVVQLRDVYKDAQVQNESARTGIAQSGEQRQVEGAAIKKQTELADSQAGFRAVDASLDRMGQLADGLAKHPGLDTIGGWSGFFGMHKIPGEGKDASVKLDSLKSQLVVNALGELKKMSSTGASGFGQLSEKEGERLESLVANLQAAQSDEQIRSAVREIGKFSAEARGRLRDHYNSLPGNTGNPLPSQDSAPAPAAMSLDDYLSSKRPKRSDTPVSPREATGFIR